MNTNSPPLPDDQFSAPAEPDAAAPPAAGGEDGAPGAGSLGPVTDAVHLATDAAGPAGASAGNTHLLSSQRVDHPTIAEILLSIPQHQLTLPDGYSGPIECSDHFLNAVWSLDWLELGGLIVWADQRQVLMQVERLREEAVATGQPVPYVLAGQEVLIHPKGMGSGRQQHLPYRIEWPGVMLAFDTRQQDQRRHANYYLKVTGEACVVSGGLESYGLANAMLAELGGTLSDSWFKRLDVALDLSDVSLQEEFLPAFAQGHFVTTATKWNTWEGREGCSGFSVGTANRVKLNVYDKLLQTLKKDELYQLAMRQNRWGGRVPQSATRIEYQIHKQWLDQFHLNCADHVLKLLPTIVARLTELGKRPFFALTAGPVDRKHKHQSRVERLPNWIKAVATFQQLCGQPTEPLQNVQRSLISGRKATMSAIGYLTSAAAQGGRCVPTLADLLEFLKEQFERNELTDEDIKQNWEKKARKAGTFRESQDFPFGERSPQPPAAEDQSCF